MTVKKSALIVASLLVLAALGAGSWWWRAGQTQTRVAALLPALPDLSAAPEMLRERLTSADTEARSRTHARRGFAALARAHHANGFLAEASRSYAGLQQLEPTEARWPHLQATILAGYGDIAAALPLWRKAVELAPEYVPARLRLGDALLKTNQAAEAAATYEQVLQRDRDNPYAQLGLARLDLEAKRWDKARTRLEQVVTKTNYQLGYDLIVSLYERLGLAQRAVAVRAMAKASGAYRDPADPWLDGLIEDCFEPYRLALAAGAIGHNGDGAAARRLLERAVEVAPDDVSVRFQLGTLLVAQGQLDAAQAQLERCTVLAPDFADGWANLCALQMQQGRVTEADRTLAAGLAHCPDSPGLHLMLARKQLSAGHMAEAIAQFQESIRLRPNEADAYIELGQLYIRAGREPEAIREMTRALAAEPGNPTAIGILAFNAIATGSEAEARDWIARVRNQPRVESDQVSRLVAAFQQRFGRTP